MVYRDIKNGLGMAVHAMRSAMGSASALATAQHYQNANVEGCTSIWLNFIYLGFNSLFMVYSDIKMECASQCMP